MVSCVAVYGGPEAIEFHQKFVFDEDEQRC